MSVVCRLQEIPQCVHLASDDEKTKDGRYDETQYNVPGLGASKWAVVANIILDKDVKEYLSSGLSEEDIIQQCLSSLNQPPTPRARKLKYGKLEMRWYKILGNKISASMTTTDRKNKHFWGRGRNKGDSRQPAKRGRPRKTK